MNIIQNDLFALSLLQFMEMLNFFPGDKFLDQIEAWCKVTESLISVINNAMGWGEKKSPPQIGRVVDSRGFELGEVLESVS